MEEGLSGKVDFLAWPGGQPRLVVGPDPFLVW